MEGTDNVQYYSNFERSDWKRSKNDTTREIREGVEKREFTLQSITEMDYRISGGDEKVVTIMVKESSTNRLNVGLNYNTDLNAAALLAMTFFSDLMQAGISAYLLMLNCQPHLYLQQDIHLTGEPVRDLFQQFHI